LQGGGCLMEQKKGWKVVLFLVGMVLAILASTGCTDLKRFAYEGFSRDQWQLPNQVIQSLDLKPGNHVVDLGSGSGYFTFRLAKVVGTQGHVYAVDVDEAMNAYLTQQAREEGHQNVTVILAKSDDPLLSESNIDLLFTCNTYHHLDDRIVYFTRVRQYLRPGGRVAIIDFTQEGWFSTVFGHSTGNDVIKQEMAAAGYELQQKFDFLPKQHFLIFSPT